MANATERMPNIKLPRSSLRSEARRFPAYKKHLPLSAMPWFRTLRIKGVWLEIRLGKVAALQLLARDGGPRYEDLNSPAGEYL